MSENIHGKKGDLPINDYFERLQLEYIVCELRKKIYPSIKDQKYYERVMGYKKDKIDDISLRNQGLPTIFTSKRTKVELYNRIYNKHGLPNFIYRNAEHQKESYESDRVNYYSINSIVKILVLDEDEEVVTGKLIEVDMEKNYAKVETSEGEMIECELNFITRIL